jgi:hypothetical protein
MSMIAKESRVAHRNGYRQQHAAAAEAAMKEASVAENSQCARPRSM